MGQAELVDEIVVATGPTPDNEVIREEAIRCGYECPYTDVDEDDVLGRFIQVAGEYGADVVVRITGDCPLIDPFIVDKTIEALGKADFASNVVRRTYPRGLDVEVMPYDTLLRLDRVATPEQREHVCVAVYGDDRFKKVSVEDTQDHFHQPDGSECRWCVDTAEDFDRVSEMLEFYGDYKARLRRFYGR